MGSRKIVREKGFREGIAKLGLATLTALVPGEIVVLVMITITG